MFTSHLTTHLDDTLCMRTKLLLFPSIQLHVAIPLYDWLNLVPIDLSRMQKEYNAWVGADHARTNKGKNLFYMHSRIFQLISMLSCFILPLQEIVYSLVFCPLTCSWLFLKMYNLDMDTLLLH